MSFSNCENNIILHLSIFLELSDGIVRKSYKLEMGQDIGQLICEAGQSSSQSNIDLNPKVGKQTKLSFMYTQKVYTCSCCYMPICGKSAYNKHVESCSKYKCTKCKKLSLVNHHSKNTDVTVLQKDIHVQFVRRIILDSLILINI